MTTVSIDNLQKQERKIEKFLLGERESNIICATYKIAGMLQKRYPVILTRREIINEKLGLFVFLIREK